MDSAQAELFKQQLEGIEIAGWSIDGYHGHGKSAVVMAAVREGKRAAIKVFHPELVERYGRDIQLERIRREASLIGTSHQNLVEILDGGECSRTGHLYVAMEELPWKNLKDKLLVVPEEKIPSLIAQLASAAKFLEGRALAHRDIKPENIAISGDFQRIKLLDLGVVRPFGVAGLTDIDARVFIGTLRYSSPEFLRREEVDSEEGWRAISFYQIGAVLHDLLMRRELFHEHTEPFACLVEAVFSINPEVYGKDVDLVRLCRNCLVKDPRARLELVGWGSFAPSDGSDDREELLRRIRERQTYYAQMGAHREAGAEAIRLVKQKLQAASSSLDYKLGRLLTTLKCFPLHSISPKVEVDGRRCSSKISFSTDTAIGLAEKLAFDFVLSMIDENAERAIYVLEASASVGGNELASLTRIGSGELDDAVSDRAIEEWMLQMLKAAYDRLEESAFVKD